MSAFDNSSGSAAAAAAAAASRALSALQGQPVQMNVARPGGNFMAPKQGILTPQVTGQKYQDRMNAWLRNRLSPTRYVGRGQRADISVRVPRSQRNRIQARSPRQAAAQNQFVQNSRRESAALSMIKRGAPKRPVRKQFQSLEAYRTAYQQWITDFGNFLDTNNLRDTYNDIMKRRNRLAGARRKRTNREKKIEALGQFLGPQLTGMNYDQRRRYIKKLLNENWYGHGQGNYVKVDEQGQPVLYKSGPRQGQPITINVPQGGYAGISQRQPWNRTVMGKLDSGQPHKTDLAILSAIASVPGGIHNTADCAAATIGGRPKPERRRTEKDYLRKNSMKERYKNARWEKKVVPLMNRHARFRDYVQNNQITKSQLNTLATSAVKNFGPKVRALHEAFPELRKLLKFTGPETREIMQNTMDSFKPGGDNDNPSIRVLQDAVDMARAAASTGQLDKRTMNAIMQQMAMNYNRVDGRVGRKGYGAPVKSEAKLKKEPRLRKRKDYDEADQYDSPSPMKRIKREIPKKYGRGARRVASPPSLMQRSPSPPPSEDMEMADASAVPPPPPLEEVGDIEMDDIEMDNIDDTDDAALFDDAARQLLQQQSKSARSRKKKSKKSKGKAPPRDSLGRFT